MSARLVAVFVVASLTGLVFGGLRVADAVGAASGYTRITQLAELGQQVTAVAQNMENERDLTVGIASLTALQGHATEANAGPSVTAALTQDRTSEEQELAAAQRATSAAAVPVQDLAQEVVSDAAFPVSVRDSADNVLAQLGDLNALRVSVLGYAPSDIINAYSGTLTDLFSFNDEVSSSSGDAPLSNQVSALGALSRAKDQAAQQRAILYAEFLVSGLNDAGGGKPTKASPTGAPYSNFSDAAALDYAGGLQTLSIAQFLQLTYQQRFQVAATPPESEAFLAAVAGPQVQTAQTVNSMVTAANGDTRAIFPQVTTLSPGFRPAATPELWYKDQSAVVNAMRSVENQLAGQVVARSQLLQHQAFESALVTSLVTVLVILLVLGATVLVGRTLVNPLRKLQEDALEIAAVRLPARVAAAAAGTDVIEGHPIVEPIGVTSTDEIGRVARAFDQVHAEAVRLAGNEAQLRGSLNAMFISLSRRSVPLIDRLARMVDAMEQNEDDPDRLAKLFSMDHMVTRMRRNSENLLVLAGEEPVRKWTESVPLTDVTRAAASEIEQYSRVALAVQPGIMISGQAAADVVHLLAELIENATLFSPQTTQVRVTVMELSSGGVLVEVRDDGVGVSPSRLADMNWRLDHPPVVDVSISRHMGLYAVSRLAARHGIRVKLRPGAPQGLSALVWLPGTLAKREAAPPAVGHSRQFGVDATGPVQGLRQPMPARQVTGRHRGGIGVGGEHPLSAGPGGPGGPGTQGMPVGAGAPAGLGARSGLGSQAGMGAQAGAGAPAARPATWFAAKRPSSGAAPAPTEEVATSWQPPANGGAAAAAAAASSAASEQAEQTSSGLPRRVPRTSAFPGSDTPGFGLAPAAAAEPRVPVLGAPPGGTAPQGSPYQGGSYQEQVPSRRRSPEAARSRLSGFQLGSRDAVQADQGTSWTPFAGEENSR